MALCREHLAANVERRGDKRAVRYMRRYYPGYLKGLPGSSTLRNRLNRADPLEEVHGLYAEYEAYLAHREAEGLSVIFISHKLHEVMAASDRVVVLRRGRVAAERRHEADAVAATMSAGRWIYRNPEFAPPLHAPQPARREIGARALAETANN